MGVVCLLCFSFATHSISKKKKKKKKTEKEKKK